MFTLLAYKPDRDDYCRGCLMASYPSDLRIHPRLDTSELISIWAKILLKNKDHQGTYQVQISENGKIVYDDLNNDMSWSDFELEYPENYVEIYDAKINEILKMKIEVEKTADHQYQIQKDQERNQKLVEQQEKEVAQKESRRKEYHQLKNEFEAIIKDGEEDNV